MQSFYQFLIEATPPPSPNAPKDAKGPPPQPSGSKSGGGMPSGFGSGMPPGLGGGPPIGLGGGPPVGAPSLGGGLGGTGDPTNPNATPAPKIQDLKTLNVFKSLEKILASRQKSKN